MAPFRSFVDGVCNFMAEDADGGEPLLRLRSRDDRLCVADVADGLVDAGLDVEADVAVAVEAEAVLHQEEVVRQDNVELFLLRLHRPEDGLEHLLEQVRRVFGERPVRLHVGEEGLLNRLRFLDVQDALLHLGSDDLRRVRPEIHGNQ